MASTNSQTPFSSISSSTPTMWDVFLSFRGIDTRYNFTNHLYSALDRHNIRTFMDDPDLRSGEVTSNALLEAIHESKTYIVVFSENYASSRWCLDELVEILNCSKTMQRLVIPVFYNIHPSVVRFQTASFEKHFEEHEVRFAGEIERVKNWRLTLRQLADKSGYHPDGKRSEADIVYEIVDEILLQIKPTLLHVARYPVGLNSRVDDITALLSGSTEAVIKIGIYGMGGVGKTTLAKAVFNDQLLLGSFEGSCFLANVRETSGTLNGLESLQQQLINDVLKSKDKVEVCTVDEGTKLIESRICSTKILVVIDDLEDHKEFKSLVGPFASGSVVIITTRDEGTLDEVEVGTKYRYRVNEMGDAESEKLFSLHAFRNTKPNNTLMIMSKDILRLAGGLPLALKVFGSYLYQKSEGSWKYYIDTLQRYPNSTIQKRLMISLNGLESDDPLLKKMFLDIACFFIGRKIEEVVEILDTYYSYAEVKIDILMKKCLLTINDDNEFRMHGLLQDVGKEIVRNNSPDEPGKHSRLWKPKDIYYVLEERKGTEAIEGIMLHRFKEVSFGMETFRRMSKLRFLSFNGINLTGKFGRTLEDLRWFCWSGCPLKCLPFDFHPQKIVILELPHSKMTTMWEVNKVPNALEKLKTLNMSFSRDLTTTPHFRRLPCLRKLNFEGCTSLKEVHNSIGSLVSLVSLNLNFCENLRSVPDTICNLRALEVICIQGCTMLEALPIQLGNIKSLKELNAACLAVSKLPDSIGNLSKLVKLEIGHNKELECLPDTICNLRALEVLNISHCTKVKELPEELGKIESLKELNAAWLAISKLPDSICNMRSLEILDISDCDKLERLPDQLWKLTRLKARQKDSESPEKLANYSEELSTVPPGQKHSEADEWEWGLTLNTWLLKVRGQKGSKSTKNSGEASVSMNALSTGSQADEMEVQLDFQESYYNLFDIEELLGLLKKDLEYNVLESKHVLVRNLKVMDIWVPKLSEIPNNLSFPDLEKLFLYTNSDSKNIPDSFFKGRPVVHYSNLDLSSIPPSFFERMSSLKELNLTDSRMKTLPPSVLKLINLEILILKGCAQLIEIPHNISALENLTALDLTGCTNLVEIPEAIESLKRLTSLDLTDCESLTKLPESISEIPFLQNIKLSGCSSLFEFHGPQVSVKCLSWNIGERNRKQVELDFHETQGTPSDITEILGLMEKVLQHQLLKSEELEVAVIKLKVIHTSKSKVPEIPKKLRFPDLEKLVLQPDIDLMISSITSSFFEPLPTFKVLDMSHTHIKTLPSCVYELTDLKGLILQRCELLTELPDGIGALENLELLDLEGTDLVCLPNELGKLINLKCLKVSLYDDESYRISKKIIDIIPTAVLSKLTKLEELSINFDPQDVWCSALVKAIIADLLSLRKLKTLKLYLPTVELLQNLMELKSNEDDLSIHKNLSNFTVIIGPHGQRFISRLPCDLEEEYLKLKKCLKYIGGKNTSEFSDALKHANALYLDRHWNIQKLSVFKADELNKLKFCMLVDCNEMQTVFDASDFSLEDNSFSLQYLAIHYLKNLEEIGKGPSVGCCLQALKVLVLHMCPNLTTIFTPVLLGDLVNLEEIIVEDCAKITSLIAKDSTQMNGTEYLPRLKKMTLLYLPKLESISSGISIGPELENVIIYNCPKLKTLPSLGVRNEEVIKIKGKGEWWNALEWIGGRPQYLHNAFSELDMEGDFLEELATQYVNSLRLFVECNAE